jgi:outer membrane protein assembly factor BamB
VLDGNRVYQIENGSRLKAYDFETGRELWRQPLGTVQKAPLVLADGKLYVGTESGKFFIVRPSADRAQVLSEVELPVSKDSAQQQEGTPEPILAGAAVSRGRIFFVSSDAVYAIGSKTAKTLTGTVVDAPAEKGEGEAALVQVSPTELVLKPGQKSSCAPVSSMPKAVSCARKPPPRGRYRD